MARQSIPGASTEKFIRPWPEDNLWCGTTTVYAGSFTQGRVYEQIKEILPGVNDQIVIAEQLHQNKVAFVSEKDGGYTVAKVDGLVTDTPSVLLGVRTADCIPIFFYDPAKVIVGIAHAGWRGTLGRISFEMVNLFKKLGSKTKNIEVYLGPHIKVECYEVGREVAKKFIDEFKTESIVRYIKGKIFLNLSAVQRITLKSIDILEQNIQVSPYCTFCNNIFYSYRRDYKIGKAFNESLSFIGIK